MSINKLSGILLITTILTIPAHADTTGPWKGFVCKATEWHNCLKGKKRIYPDPNTYVNKKMCIEKFGTLFEEDPEMSSKYPRTEDIKESYIFDCEESKPTAKRVKTE